MAKKEIIISANKDQARIAILEKGELAELHIENPSNTRTIGDIHIARVRNLMPSIQAAFVDIGMKQDAFLHFSDVSETLPHLLKILGEPVAAADFTVSLRTRRRAAGADVDEELADDGEDDKTNKKGSSARGRSGKPEGKPDTSRGRSGKPDGKPVASQGKAKSSGNKGEAAEKSAQKATAESLGPDAEEDVIHPARYLKNNQRVLVQIIKEPMSNKGSRVTTNVTMAGRFLVLVPYGDYVAVSRRIWSGKERRRLRTLAKSLLPDNFGLIVRTVAEGRDAKTLDRDLRLLLKKWDRVQEKIKKKPKPPTLVIQDVSMVSSIIRDLFTEDYARVLIDDPRLFRSIKNYIQAVAPDMVPVIQLHKGEKSIFEQVGIANAIAEAFSERVNLPSGGYIFIEHTEAMHVIDVNSGRAGHGKGKTQEQNSLQVNIESARIIAKHLRLRDLGGIIVVDFIDQRDEKNRKKVVDELKRAFRKDRAVTKVLPMSDFGLVQITRQRLRPSITMDQNLSEDVQAELADAIESKNGESAPSKPVASPKGSSNKKASRKTTPKRQKDKPKKKRISQKEFLLLVDRWLGDYRTRSENRTVQLRVHPFAAAFLKQGVPSALMRWRLKHRVRIQLETDESLRPTDYAFKDPVTLRDITAQFSNQN